LLQYLAVETLGLLKPPGLASGVGFLDQRVDGVSPGRGRWSGSLRGGRAGYERQE
jgi:hypothetical protein